MPVTVESALTGPYTPNGVTVDFPFDFKADSASEVIVLDQDGIELSTALYSVELNPDEGGTVTFSVAPEAADYDTLYVKSNPAMTTLADFGNTGPSFNPVSLTRAIDRTAIRDIYLRGLSDRAIKLPIGTIVSDLPDAATRAGKYLGFDVATGDVELLDGTGTTTGAALISFQPLGSGAVIRSAQDKLRETVSPLDFGAAGDGVTNDIVAMLAALATGKVVDLGGKTYAISGTMVPTTFKGMVNGKLKQLAPTTLNCKTMKLYGLSDFYMRNVTIDRGGSAGYTVGNLDNYAGLWIENCSNFRFANVLATNGGRGNGMLIWGCANFDMVSCGSTELYWQEVAPGTPVIVDDIVQPFWFVYSDNFTLTNCYALNCTSGAPGAPTTNVAANQKYRYSRWAFSGNTNFSLIGCRSKNIDQCFDFTGSAGNSAFTLSACVAKDGGSNGFKLANSAHQATVSSCIAENIGLNAFLVGGKTEVANPDPRDINFVNCIALNTGSNKVWGAQAGRAFFVEHGDFDATMPGSIQFSSCKVVDTQGLTLTIAPGAAAVSATLGTAFTGSTGTYSAAFDTGETKTVTLTNGAASVTWSGGLTFATSKAFLYLPTHQYAFGNEIAAVEYPAVGHLRPLTVNCVNCVVDVMGLATASRFFGIHHPYGLFAGGGGADACATATWTTLTLDGTDLQDPSKLHNAASSNDVVYIKEPGLYVLTARSAFPTSSAGTARGVRVTVNASADDASWVAPHATQKTWMAGTFFRFLNSGDLIRIQAYQDSGGSLNVSRVDTFLSLVKVS